ncbi:hypothetical protein YC2023_028914 [Brassica napus]
MLKLQNVPKIPFKSTVLLMVIWEPPPSTEPVRKTHTHKDDSFIDERTEELVLEVGETVDPMTLNEDSPNGVSQTASTEQLQDASYLIKNISSMDRQAKGTNAKLVNTNVELLKTDMTTLKGDFIALETDIKLEMVATREPPSTRFYRLLV